MAERRPRRIGLHLASITTAMLLATLATSARADEKDACATAAESAQLLQRQGSLLRAREQALVCARLVCPPIVKQDCDALYASLELTIPSVVIAVHDEAGKDLPFASVTIDGAEVPVTSGQAVRLDPGTHLLHARADKYGAVDQRIVLREGERARPVVITLASTDKPPAPPVPAAPRPVEAAPPARSTHPLVWVFGTLSLVSAAGFAIFEVQAINDSKHFKRTCAPRCSDDDVDTVRTESTLGAISGIAALAFAGGAVGVWLVDRDPMKAPKADQRAVSVGVGPNGISVVGAF